MINSGLKYLTLSVFLMGIVAACGSSTVETTGTGGDDEDECTTSEDCDLGICENGECVVWEFLESCSDNEQCESGICIDTDDGGVCSQECDADSDCEDEGWSCQFDEDAGNEICLPAPELPPADGSTLCAAGGVSEGGGHQLIHCLGPYDAAAGTLNGEGVNLQSGGFQMITAQ